MVAGPGVEVLHETVLSLQVYRQITKWSWMRPAAKP